MAVLPDKILEDAEIEAFVERVNQSAENIVSDSKFKISSPNLPGIGLLLKLQIRAFEKSLAGTFAPIFIGKKALSEGFSGIKTAFESIQTIFSNPLQFLLDEGVNSILGEFPFPIRLEIGGGIDGDLKDKFADLLTDKKQTGDPLDKLQNFNYTLVYNSNTNPASGEITTSSSSVKDVSKIVVSGITKNEQKNDLLALLKPGDSIQLSDQEFSGSFTINSISVNSDNTFSLSVSLNSISSLDSPDGEVNVPGLKNSKLSADRNIFLRQFLDENGNLKIPISALGLTLPLLSSLSISLGDFSKLRDDSPAKKFMEKLSERSGLQFSEIFAGIIDGKFPKIDFEQLQKDASEGNTESTEKAKEDMVVLGRLLQIGSSDPLFLIKIIFNYVKLLLLPINVVIGVIKGLAEIITGPISLIKTLIRGIINPLGLLCDLISKAFLEALRPYIQNPILSIGMTWEEALNEPDSDRRGLQPLISDMVCGKFSRDLKNYTPDQSFFQNLANTIPDKQMDQFQPGLNIDYNTFFDSRNPSQGEVSVNNSDPKQVTVFKVSVISSTVENSTPLLTSLNVGDEFSFSLQDSFSVFRVGTKKFVTDTESPFFEFTVQYLKSDLEKAQEKSIEELQLEGIDNGSLKSKLNVSNPDKTFLFIIEKYLPVKMIAVWESIKGVIAIFGGLAQQVPSLLPAIIRSLLGLNTNKSVEELVEAIKNEESGGGSASIEGAAQTINLLYDGESSLMYLGTDNQSKGGSNYEQEARDALELLVQNSSTDNEPGIENIFYDLLVGQKEAGKPTSIVKDNLSSDPGKDTTDNKFLNYIKSNAYQFADLAPSKNNFYYGEFGLVDLGNSVKVLSVIMLQFKDFYYFSNNNVNLEDVSITVYIKPADGGARTTLYSGNVYNALQRYKLTNQGFDKRVDYRDVRIIINREMNFLVNYALPSLQ